MDDTVIPRLRRSRLDSERLGIDLASRTDVELFKWFLASQLYGARVSRSIAENTYRVFVRRRWVTPASLLKAGAARVVDDVMREGGYTRWDEPKARQILASCKRLRETYDGSLTALHETAADARDLERRLRAFDGIGPVTVNIFLRELRPRWRRADPEPLPAVFEAAHRAGVNLTLLGRGTLSFARVEAGLLRGEW